MQYCEKQLTFVTALSKHTSKTVKQRLYLLNERISLRHASHGRQRVLNDAHDGSVRLRRDQHARRAGQLRDFRARLQRLCNVQIHFVTVEIRVVRRRTTVQTQYCS